LIPKPGKKEKRPLGIPTMRDRATQALAKLALEPQWEAKFEPHSYGFRPGRSAHDAAKYLFLSIRRQDKYVLDADIKKCFDRINHQALLNKLDTFPQMRRAVKAWLKAGIFENGELLFPQAGTPQGGIISPLLANIALHGLEEYITSHFPSRKRLGSIKEALWKPIVVRYADDIIVMHRDINELEKAKELAEIWLKNMGLEFSQEKTRIVHTYHEYNGEKPGFEFLGFSFNQFKLGKRIEKVKTRLNSKLSVTGILPTLHQNQTLHAKEVLDDLNKTYGELMFSAPIPMTVKLADSVMAGQSIIQFMPKSPAAKAYKKLAKEVEQRV
ncbi:MAG: hypothetical protein F6J89_33740, partial [Symploca sp. SIO1C4]|nr:hypothetical protein [Symploca sp. SIO1C4]